jgi:hypothetical protein
VAQTASSTFVLRMTMPSRTCPKLQTKCQQLMNARKGRSILKQPCLEQRRHVSPLVVSQNGLLAKEGQRSHNSAEATFHLASQEVGDTLRSVWTCQCLNEHCHRQSHPSLSPWMSYSDDQNGRLPPWEEKKSDWTHACLFVVLWLFV